MRIDYTPGQPVHFVPSGRHARKHLLMKTFTDVFPDPPIILPSGFLDTLEREMMTTGGSWRQHWYRSPAAAAKLTPRQRRRAKKRHNRGLKMANSHDWPFNMIETITLTDSDGEPVL